MRHDGTPVAGIDAAKNKLDIAITGSGEPVTLANAPAGRRQLAEHLAAAGVKRVGIEASGIEASGIEASGIEASGGYERGVVDKHLRAAGFTVPVLPPLQVKARARMHPRRAKNDRIDAALIAAFRWNPALIVLHRRLNERDRLHNTVEVYHLSGRRHLGEFDPWDAR